VQVTGRPPLTFQFGTHNALSTRFSYAPNLKRFIVTLPLPLHESLLVPMRDSIVAALGSIPHNDEFGVFITTQLNTDIARQDDNASNLGTPDLQLLIDGWDTTDHPVWITEVAFSQTADEAIDKMQEFANARSDIIAFTLIDIVEEARHALPKANSEIEMMLHSDYVPLVEEVLSSGHVWLHPLHVEITTWMRPPDGPFDLRSVNNVDCVSAVSRLLLLLFESSVHSLSGAVSSHGSSGSCADAGTLSAYSGPGASCLD
jgi:hypothetical protein